MLTHALARHARLLLLPALLLAGSCHDGPVAPQQPRAPARLEILGGNDQQGSAGAELPEPIALRVTDAEGRAVRRVLVDFAVVAGGGRLSAGALTANDSGIVRVRWTLGTAVRDSQRVAASVTDVGNGHELVRLVLRAAAVAAAPAEVTITGGDQQEGDAGEALPTPLAVRVSDAFGNPVADATVTWSVDTGGGAVVPTASSTTASGDAEARLTLGPEPGGNTVVVSLAGTPRATFHATGRTAAAASVRIAGGDGQTAPVGTTLPLPLVVRVLNHGGNPVKGAIVGWTASGGATVPSGTSLADRDGLASITVTLGTTTGAATITAAVAGLPSVTFTATATPGAPAALVKVSGDAQRAEATTTLPEPLVVRVADAHGNAVPGVAVAWEAASGATDPTTVATDADGHAATRWTLGAPGASTATASVAALPPATFTATAVAGAPAVIALEGAAAPDTVDARVTVTATVGDAHGYPVSGATVAWAITAGEGSVAPATSITGAAGHAAAVLTLGARAGSNTLAATVGTLAPATFTKLAAPGVATRAEKRGGDQQSAPRGATLPESLVVAAMDRHDNPVPGVVVQWTIVEGGGSLAPSSSTTDLSGLARTRWTLGAGAGVQQAAAALPGAPATLFTATALAPVPHAIAVAGGDAQTGTVGRTLPAPLVVRVTDAEDAPIEGATVAWTVLEGGGTVSAASSVSDARGEASVSFTLGTTSGAPNVVQAGAGAAFTARFTATAVPDAPASVEVAGGDAQQAFAGTLLLDPIVVRVVDRYGNAAVGATVAWAVTEGGGALSPASSTVDANGLASTRWTLGWSFTTPVVTNAATASVGALAPAAFTARGQPAPPASVTAVSGNGQTAQVMTMLPAPLVVRVLDAAGLPMLTAVTWSVTQGSSTISYSTSTTAPDGQSAFTMPPLGTTAGPVSVTAGVGPATPATFAATATPAPACSVTWSVSPQTAQIFQTVTIWAAVVDQYGNRIGAPGVPSPLVATPVAEPPTSANGSVMGDGFTPLFVWYLGAQPGTQRAHATAYACDRNVAPWGRPVARDTVLAVATTAPPLDVVAFDPTPASDSAGTVTEVQAWVGYSFNHTGVGGVPVSWKVVEGGGFLTSSSIYDYVTSPQGGAAIQWHLGTTAGRNVLVVSAAGRADTVVFTTRPATPHHLRILGGDGQTGPAGQALVLPLTVAAVDRFDNPIEGITIEWHALTPGSTAAPATSVTGPAGAQTYWTLSSTPGTQSLAAYGNAAGRLLSGAVFTATATTAP